MTRTLNIEQKFYYEKGYYEAYSVHDLDGAFINFFEMMYDYFVASGERIFIESIIEEIWEDEYNLKEDLDYESYIDKCEYKIMELIK